jgi:hypothetical protein
VSFFINAAIPLDGLVIDAPGGDADVAFLPLFLDWLILTTRFVRS